MKVLGIICEYNPFHKGHRYHIEESLIKTGADAVICLMSGDFVQRGDPAIISKWKRAETAILNGADLVLELPCIYSTASAEAFAYGAVNIMNKLGIIDWLTFGSESDDLESLQKLALLLNYETEEYKSLLKDNLKQGHSYPCARQKAIEMINRHLALFLKGSNNVLAIEYLKALNKLKSNISPISIKRISSDYKSKKTQGEFSSATAIRELLLTGKDVKPFVPLSSLKILCDSEYRDLNDFDSILLYLLRSIDPEELSMIDYMNDGVDNIFKNRILKTNNISALLKLSANKRHTETRLKRALTNLLLGIKRDLRQNTLKSFDDHYARVLAFDKVGAKLLSDMKSQEQLKIITKSANYKRQLGEEASNLFELDLKASDIYSNIKRNDYLADITISPFILR